MRQSKKARAGIVTLIIAVLGAAACGGKDATQDEAAAAGDAAQLYKEASRQINLGGFDRAVALLERLELFFPFSDYTRRGQLDLIYAYYKNGDTESAIDAANEFIRENPTYADVDYAYYLRGLIYFEREANPLEKTFRVDLSERPPESAERSLSYFGELIRRFPESDYAPDAQQRIVYLRHRLAQFEVHVARYYLSRSAWVAASARAKNVVENFSDTDAVGEALQIMARAYRKLGMDDLAADAERVMKENELSGSRGNRKRGLFGLGRKPVPQRPVASPDAQ